MNNTFNLKRFLWLFNKHTKEHYKTYLISVTVLAGILTITLGFAAYSDWFGSGPQSGIFYTFLLLAGSIFTSMVFSDLGNKKKAISMLTLPVSHFERYLVGWIYSFIIFQFVFIACFYAVALTVESVGNSFPGHKYHVFNIFSGQEEAYAIFVFFWFLHAISFMGAVFFKKLHFIKTAFAFFTILVIFTLFNQAIITSIFGVHFQGTAPFGGVVFRENGSEVGLSAPESNPAIVVMVFIVSICIWAAAFFKMKEKQV